MKRKEERWIKQLIDEDKVEYVFGDGATAIKPRVIDEETLKLNLEKATKLFADKVDKDYEARKAKERKAERNFLDYVVTF